MDCEDFFLCASLQVKLQLYNIGRPTLRRLGAVASTVHLKMRFYSSNDDVITLNSELYSAQMCHFLSMKSVQEEFVTEKPKKKKHGKEADVNLGDLDARCKPDSLKGEEDDALHNELKKKIKRLKLGYEFLPIQLDEDPEKTIKVGVNLSDEVKEGIIKFLRKHADLLAWSTIDMQEFPRIFPTIISLLIPRQSGWGNEEESSQLKSLRLHLRL